MKHLLFWFVVTLYSLQSVGQTRSKVYLKGKIIDSEYRTPLPAASVSILSLKDSLRVASARANVSGVFVLDSISSDEYLLFVSYIGYNNAYINIDLRGKSDSVELKSILMKKVGYTLSEVNIKEERSNIRISGDTLEFRAETFKLRQNSALEELLKKLPGTTVDSDGTVRVNGEIVKTILVDGHPFFANDPRIASRNLETSMIDKVQIIDRKIKDRDPSNFSSIETEKAINITIKNEKRNLWTGKLIGGIGTGGLFLSKIGFSRFRDRDQIAHFTDGDNTNGLQNGDREGNSGIIRKWNSNTSYSVDLNSRMRISINLLFGNSKDVSITGSSRQNFVADSSYYYNQESKTESNSNTGVISTQMDYKLDSMWTIGYSNFFNFSISRNMLLKSHFSNGSQFQLLDSGFVNNQQNNKNYGFNNSIIVSKRFRHAGRMLDIKLDYSRLYSSNFDYNLSSTLFAKSDGYNIDSVNQSNHLSNNSQSTQLVITYNEPLLDDLAIVSSYGIISYKNPVSRFSFEFNPVTKRYDKLNAGFTGDFNGYLLNQFGRIGIQSKKQLCSFDFSILFMFNYMASDDLRSGGVARQNSISIMPRGNFNLVLSKGKRLRVSLIGNPIMPTMEQLLPLPDKSNPLLIRLGNINLKPGSIKGLTMSYTSMDPSSMRYLGIVVNGTLVRNKIVNSSWLDTLNRQLIKPVNMNGTYDFRLSINFSTPLKKNRDAFTINNGMSMTRNPSYINGVAGYSLIYSFSQSLGYNYSYKELFSIYAGMNLSCYKVNYIQDDRWIVSYNNYSAVMDLNFRLPLAVDFGSKINYSVDVGRGEGFNSNFVILNLSLSKYLFASRRILLKIQGCDLLNNNMGIVRESGPGYIEDLKFNVLQRNYFLSLTYFMNKNK